MRYGSFAKATLYNLIQFIYKKIYETKLKSEYHIIRLNPNIIIRCNRNWLKFYIINEIEP